MTSSFIRSIGLINVLLTVLQAIPLQQSGEKNSMKENEKKKTSPVKVIDFLQKFGYLESGDSSSSALFTEEAVVSAIKDMQYFGGINETGELDDRTIKLLETPRCGVRDTRIKRKKRFVVGGEGWKKRLITYNLSNWYPDIGEHRVKMALKKAFEAWERYSTLKFVEDSYSTSDIRIFFAPGYHLDGYPFDGPGGVLAHAYYPYEADDYGGDIHFDYDERWTLDEKEGMDFFDVAIHEIGHSLGLAHSNVPDSVMFAYYTGKRDTDHLSEDDVRALYHLYITKQLDNTDFERYFGNGAPSNPETDTTTESNSQSDDEIESDTTVMTPAHGPIVTPFPDIPVATPFPESTTTDTTSDSTTESEISYEGDYETVDDMLRRISDDCITYNACIKNETEEQVPDICEGDFDAIGVYRREIFVYKGKYLWRYSARNYLEPNYPVPFRQLFFQFPKEIDKIDATYERPIDHKIIFFTGMHYWVHDGNYFVEDSPQPITKLGLPADLERVNGAMVWGKNAQTYFFGSEEYWKYDEANRKIVDGYPKLMMNWRLIPDDIDAVATFGKGETYFFKGLDCYRFDDDRILVHEKYPLPASQFLFGCPEVSEK